MKRTQVLLARVAQSRAARGALVVGTGLTAISAHAAAGDVDVSAVVTAITAAGVAIGAVGIAYLGMTVGAKVFKWVKQAF